MKKIEVDEDGVEYYSKNGRRYYKCEIFGERRQFVWRKKSDTKGMSIDKEANCYIERIGW